MSIQEKKQLLIENKEFLASLLTTKAKLRNIILEADNSELNLLIKLIFWFASGTIPINRALLKKIQKTANLTHFHKFLTKEQGNILAIKAKRSKKLDIIISILPLLPAFVKILET